MVLMVAVAASQSTKKMEWKERIRRISSRDLSMRATLLVIGISKHKKYRAFFISNWRSTPEMVSHKAYLSWRCPPGGICSSSWGTSWGSGSTAAVPRSPPRSPATSPRRGWGAWSRSHNSPPAPSTFGWDTRRRPWWAEAAQDPTSTTLTRREAAPRTSYWMLHGAAGSSKSEELSACDHMTVTNPELRTERW